MDSNDGNRDAKTMRPDPPIDPAPAPPPGVRCLRVVVVDDSAVIRERIAVALGALPGVEIAGVLAEAATAIVAIDALVPDLVVLDVNLGDGDGWPVLRHVRHRLAGSVVLVFSNDVSPPVRDRYLGAGARGYFDKSLEFEALRDAVLALARERAAGDGAPSPEERV
ncbi:MAG: response regulator [Lautropia sp.]